MDIEPLLQPITPENPCGDDLSYDPSFNELETLAKGKEGAQISDNPEWQVAAEEPDWKAVRDKCCELFTRSKDLRIATTLTLALLRLEGLAGLRDGITLLQRLVREQWEGVYPRLDPEDNNDPTQRVNTIAGLAKPLATFGDPMRFIERIRNAPLSNSVQMGRFSLADITGIGLPPGATATPPTPDQVEAAFRDTSVDDLTTLATAANSAKTALNDLDSALMELVGSGSAPSFEDLNNTLGEIASTLAPYLPPDASNALDALMGDLPTDAGGDSSSGSSSSSGGGSFSGEIKSRADVARAIDQICEYYRQAEPGSPVPLLLKRAQRLVDLDFMALMEDLLPDSLAAIATLTGQRPAVETSSEPPPEETPSE